ncbi:MAG: tetratricopeptide repeat protein, partial [Phycisphaerae bacterium]|nr:tetratricopeptide repeat protein [Phycisphaerae bacterium]MDW8260969.1 tetratricopeptide repeat protein [Phycisphaerales bacterium]
DALDPASPASDSTLLAIRALSMLAVDRTNDARAIVQQLKKRSGDGAAQGWSAAIEARLSFADVPPNQLISRYLAAMARGGENGIIRLWIGDAHLHLGETEHAIREWRQAAELMPSWASPHVKIARALLSINRPMDALDSANAAFRCAPDQLAVLTTLALARHAVLRQNPSARDQEELATLVAEIQNRKPGEPETLALHAAMLCRAGKHAAAEQAIREALSNANQWEPDVLAEVLSVCREFSLNLSEELLKATSDAADRFPRMALRHALEEARNGDVDAARERLQRRALAAPDAQRLAWQIALAQFRESLGDPEALSAWVALGDAHPDDFNVQSLILRSAASAQQDRAFFARTIDRVRKLTGEDGAIWRYARARFLLTGQPTQQESAEAVTLLTDLVRASPSVPQYRIRLAAALENLGNTREAAEQLRAAAEIDPRSAGVHMELARLLIEQGKHPEARVHLERAAASPMIELDRRLPLARMLSEQGQLPLAVQVLEGAPSRDLPADLLLADLYSRLDQPERAEQIFQRRLESDRSAELLSSAADFFAGRGDVERARQVLNRLGETNLPSAQRYALLARFEERYGSRPAARELYLKATEQAPTDPALWRRLALFLARSGCYEEAASAAERGLALSPGHVELQSLRLQAKAMAKVASGSTDLNPLIELLTADPDRAPEAQALAAMRDILATTQPSHLQLSRLRQSADRFPRYLPLQAMLAGAYKQAGLTEDALNIAQRVLETMPGDPAAVELATSIFRATRQWSRMRSAAQQWKTLASADSRGPDLAIAEASLKLGQPAQALQVLIPYLAAAASKPDDNATLLQIAASAMMADGQTERTEDLLGPMLASSRAARMIWMRVTGESAPDAILASEWLNRVQVSIDPQSYTEVAQFARAASLVASRFADPAPARAAVELLRPFLTGDTASAEALFLAGSLQLQLGRMKEAETAYRRALALKPDSPEARNDLAYVLLLRRGNLNEARELAARAVEQSPTTATYFDTLARIDAELGNREAAMASYEAALRLEPSNLDALIGKAHLLRVMGQPGESRKLLSQIEPLLPGARPLSEPARRQLQELRQHAGGQ